MSRSRLGETSFLAISAAGPALLAAYLIRGSGLYLILLTVSLAILLIYVLADLLRQTPATTIQPRRSVKIPRNSLIPTGLSALTAVSALVLEKRVMAWIMGRKGDVGGLPWAASLFLLFLAAFLYAWNDRHARWETIFEGKPRKVLILGASMVIVITFTSAFWVKSMEFYTSGMKAAFSVLLGACVSASLSRAKYISRSFKRRT